MPNENTAVCGCGIAVDVPKSRNGSIAGRKLLILPKSKSAKSEGRGSAKDQPVDDGRASKNRTSETGGSSSLGEHARAITKNNSKHEKRLNHSRRTRSADRAESHYTYIDSSSSVLGVAIRENTIPEALYATIPDDTPTACANEIRCSQANSQNRPQPVYAIPSMTSPPPTYDAAIAKSWQSGLLPTYEEYLCHKYAMVSRSHTPPPPWSDSNTTSTTVAPPPPPISTLQSRREFLANELELREYLAQLAISQSNEQPPHYQQHQSHTRDAGCLSNQQLLREQQVRAQQRTRAMPPRSQSESRAQQQRIATMYEDGAFCMETTALQSAFEHGVAFCSLM